MTLVIYKLIAGLVIFIASLTAVAYPLKIRALPTHNHWLELGDALASGIFLGTALFHMLPDAIQEFTAVLGSVHYPLAELLCASGFLLLLFFERLSGNTAEHQHTTSSYIIAIIIIIHSFIEGAALGINTAFSTAAIIFLAITIHKSSEGFMLAVTLNRSTLSLRHILILSGIFVLMTPIGIIVGTSLSDVFAYRNGQLLTAGFNAFAAGTFLYISTLHHINHHQRSHHGEGLMEFFAILAGLAIMAGLAVTT
jgi:zinc transporter 1/2/3